MGLDLQAVLPQGLLVRQLVVKAHQHRLCQIDQQSALTDTFHHRHIISKQLLVLLSRVWTEKFFQNSQTFHKPLQYGTEKQHEGMQLFHTSVSYTHLRAHETA